MTDYPLVQHLREFDPLVGGATVTLSEGDTRATIEFPETSGSPRPTYGYELTAPLDLPDESVWPSMGLRAEVSVTGDSGLVLWQMAADHATEPYYTAWWNSYEPDFGAAPDSSNVYDLTDGGWLEFGAAISVPEFIARLQAVDYRHVYGEVRSIQDAPPMTVTSFRVVLYTIDSAAWYEPPLRQYPRQDDRASMGVRRMWPRTDPRRIGHIP